jgi:hypothetical protein
MKRSLFVYFSQLVLFTLHHPWPALALVWSGFALRDCENSLFSFNFSSTGTGIDFFIVAKAEPEDVSHFFLLELTNLNFTQCKR